MRNIARSAAVALTCFISEMAHPAAVSAETLAEKLIAQYEQIQTLTCDIRRDTETSDNKITTLSHVTFQRPDRLFVENVTPVKRTIVADSTNFFSFIEGDPKGFSRPVSQLNEEMLISLRKVPGTAMDHLLRLKGVPEAEFEATGEFPVRKSYDTGNVYVILSLDGEARLARIEFFRSKEMQEKTAQYDYSHFQEVLPGLWIPALHRLTYSQGGVDASESSRIDNLQVNKPVDQALFDASRYFKGVHFVGSFDEIYQSGE